MIDITIGRVASGENLSMKEMAEAIDLIMQGKCDRTEIGLLLTALRTKGETVAEVAGAASAMRQHMRKISTNRDKVLDTCGTGGDGSNTFNISTAAAIVAASAGATVAKHGNRGITSKSGSADVLRELGVNVDANVTQVEACLNEVGICFCFAPLFHQSMKHVAEVRKQLGVPTIFNLLGPLCNPANAPYQLLGVGKPHLRSLLAESLQMLGTKRAIVVHGEDGLDEVTLSAKTLVSECRDDQLHEFTWTPEEFGMELSGRDTMMVDGPESSASLIRQILDGEPGPPREIVILNAAAALWTIEENTSLRVCAGRAAEAIDSGAARDVLARLGEVSAA